MKRVIFSGVVLICGIFLFSLTSHSDHPAAEAFTSQQSISASWGTDSRRADITHVYHNSTHYVYAVWLEGGIPGAAYFSRSTDGGTTWSTPLNLSVTSNAYTVRITARSTYVHVVIEWVNPGEIWYIRSTDHGENWDTANDWEQITVNTGDSAHPDIACSGPNGTTIYIVWHDDSPFGYNTIFFKYNSSWGQDGYWSSAQRLTWTPVGALYPRIESGNTSSSGGWGNVYVVFHDFMFGQGEIFYNYNTNFGFSPDWSGPKRLTWSSGNSIYPVVDAQQKDQYVHIAWQEYFPSKGAYNIVYKRLSNYGATIPTGITKRLSFATTSSENPAIAASDSEDSVNKWVACAWDQIIGGNHEIIWKEDYKLGDFSWNGVWASTKRLTFSSNQSYRPSMSYYPTGNGYCHVVYEDNTLTSNKFEIYFRTGW